MFTCVHTGMISEKLSSTDHVHPHILNLQNVWVSVHENWPLKNFPLYSNSIMVSQHFPYDTSCSKPLQNYMVFNDTDGVYTFAFEAEKNVSLIIIIIMSVLRLCGSINIDNAVGRVSIMFHETSSCIVFVWSNSPGVVWLPQGGPAIVRNTTIIIITN